MVARRIRLQVIKPCVADEVPLQPGTYNGEEYPQASVSLADGKAPKSYSLWPRKHLVPVMVTELVEEGVIRSLD